MTRIQPSASAKIAVVCLFGLFCSSAAFVTDLRVTPSLVSIRRNWPNYVSASSSSSLCALVYMPDGTVMKDDDEDLESAVDALGSSDIFESDLSQRSQDALLKHLMQKDMRGPLAILAAGNSDIDLKSIESVAARGISSKSVYIEAICSRGDSQLVNVPVIVEYPKAYSDGQILKACNEAYQKADAKLERTKIKIGEVVSFNPGRGFGFIALEDGSPDVYVHQSNIKMRGYRELKVGQSVEFKAGKDTRRGTGRKYAYDVVPLKEGKVGEDSVEDIDASADKETAVSGKADTPKANKKKVKQSKKKKGAGAKSEGKRLEEALASKAPSRDYGGMEIGERAFYVLLDLGLITLTPDPDSPDYDHSKDGDFAEHTVVG